MLTHQEIKRYSRQLLLDDIDEEGQRNIANAHVVIIGLGGLGSVAARYLIGAGVAAQCKARATALSCEGKLTLVDGDTVDVSNLQRQTSYNEMHLGELKTNALKSELQKVNPYASIELKSRFADSKNLHTIIQNATCVLDCTDNVSVRKAINKACVSANVPLFIASASGLTWQAININSALNESGCYHCLVSHIHVNENCVSQGILGPVVGMAACHQATQVLLYLAKKAHANIKWGHYIHADAAQGKMQSFFLPPSANCEVCQ